MNPAAHLSKNTHRALRRKEWNESRPAILVGLIIFVGLPTLWTLLLWTLDTHLGILPGIASTLWLVAGGLFSAVLGAQVICRDFGSPTERFLFSRPIDPHRIMRIKAITGFVILVGVSMLIGALELLWWSLLKGPQRTEESSVGAFVIGTGLALCSYWIAVGAACATRQSLTSAFSAAFALALMVTVPVIVRIPGVNDISDLVLSDQHSYRTDLVVAAFVAAFGVVAYIAMRWAALTERRLNVGPRTLAWIIGISLTGLFITAMREVGATESVITMWWANTPEQMATPLHKSYNQLLNMAVGKNRIAAGCAPLNHDSHADAFELLLDVNSNGHVSRERRVTLDLSRKTGYPASTIDSDGNLALIGMSRIGPPPYKPDDPWRMTLETFDWETSSKVSTIELSWPVDAEWSMVTDLLRLNDFVYVLIRTGDIGFVPSIDGIVAEYRIQDNRATLESTRPFRFSCNKQLIEQSWVVVKEFKSGARLRILTNRRQDLGLQLVDEPDEFASFTVRASQLGLAIFPVVHSASQRVNAQTDWEGAMGRVRATPWGMLFRSPNPFVIPVVGGRLVEVHDSSIIVYDSSNPAHPRRVANYLSGYNYTAFVTGELLIVNHFNDGFSIAKLPPVTKK